MKYFFIFVLAAVLIVSGCVATKSSQQAESQQSSIQQETGSQELSNGTKIVAITNFITNPNTLTVSPGTRVLWYNNDKEPHKLIENNKFFESGDIAPGGNWTMVFTTPGRYSYKCAYHSTVIGTIIVK